MFSGLKNKFQSISVKALLAVWGVAFFSLLAVSVLSYQFSKVQINNEISEKMNHNLGKTINKINLTLANHSRLPVALSRVVETYLNNSTREQYHDLLIRYAAINKDTLGCGIWFEPYTYAPDIKYFGPYAYKDGDKIVLTREYETEKYNFHQWDWYTNGKKTDKALAWSDPFYDENTKLTMVSSSAPFFDRNKKFLGVTSADMDLKSIQKFISELKIGKTGFAFVLDRQGFFLAHPQKEIIMKKKISESENISIAKLGEKIFKEEEGRGRYADPEKGNIYSIRNYRKPAGILL